MLQNISDESNPLIDCSKNYKMKFNKVMQPVLMHIRKQKDERRKRIATLLHNPLQNRFYSLNKVNQHKLEQNISHFKLLTVGDNGVGKTCFWAVFATNEFPTEYIPTVFGGYSANLLVEGFPVSFAPWDSAGGDEYSRLRPLSYPHTDVFQVCFSCSDHDSFFNCYKWVQEIREHVENPVLVLQMNKVDLRKSNRWQFVENKIVLIDSDEGEEMARNLGCITYVETSAKDNIGVNTIHEVVIRAKDLSKCITTPSNKKKCQVQ